MSITEYSISAFTEQIKAAFYAYQVVNPTSERLRADDAMDIQYWLLNPTAPGTGPKESRQKYEALRNYGFDKNGEHGLFRRNLSKSADPDKNIWLRCIKSADVFSTVARIHESTLYAG